jgi:PAS domain S-box-containing protein
MIKGQNSDPVMEVFFDIVPDLLCIASTDGHFLKLNSTWESLLGFTCEELCGHPYIEFIHPDDVAKTLSELEFLIKGRYTIFFTNRYRCKDNSYKWLEWQARANPEGDKYYAIARDITQRKMAEQALITCEDKYMVAFSTSPDAININKMDGTYVDINDGFTELTGFTREDVIGIPSLDLGIWAFPKDRETLVEGLQKQGNVKNLESVFRCKDGSLKTALMSASVIQINNEPHILSITRDITDRIMTEKALRESEEIFRSLAEYSPNMIFIVVKNKIYYVNQLCEKKLGYTKEEFFAPDFNFLQLASPEHKQLLIENLTLHAKGKEIEPYEFLMLAKDGRQLYTMINAKLIQVGNENAILGVIMDISEQRWAEEILKRKANQFEHFSTLMVDRELKMVELKQEVNDLLKKLGESAKYPLYGSY